MAALGEDDEHLVLFLPTLKERSIKANNDNNDKRRLYYWEVSMAFSERKDGKWSTSQTASEVLNTLYLPQELHFVSRMANPWGGTTDTVVYYEQDGTKAQPMLGRGLRDIDEHLTNQGLFHFEPVREGDNTARLRVYIQQFIAAEVDDVGNPRYENLTFNRQYLGEFTYDNGHVHLRSTRAQGIPADAPDSLIDASPAPGTGSFRVRIEPRLAYLRGGSGI